MKYYNEYYESPDSYPSIMILKTVNDKVIKQVKEGNYEIIVKQACINVNKLYNLFTDSEENIKNDIGHVINNAMNKFVIENQLDKISIPIFMDLNEQINIEGRLDALKNTYNIINKTGLNKFIDEIIIKDNSGFKVLETISVLYIVLKLFRV